MLPLLLSASLLAGIGASQRLGEKSPYLVVSGDIGIHNIRAEILFDSADKIETGNGYLVSGIVDVEIGILTLGSAYSHRETKVWSKDVLFGRVGIKQEPLWIIASIAPNSPNMEAKLEARLRGKIKRVLLETRFWVGSHSTSSELHGYSYGSTVLIGFNFK